MEKFEDIKSNAFDVPNTSNAPDATAITTGHEYKAKSQNGQMMRQLEVQSKKNRLRSASMLKAIIKNVAEHLRVQQKTRVAKVGKTAKVVVKEIATQKLQIKKAQIEEWKQKVMHKVASKLEGIKQAQEQAIEI